jgi:hypothetical protein
MPDGSEAQSTTFSMSFSFSDPVVTRAQTPQVFNRAMTANVIVDHLVRTYLKCCSRSSNSQPTAESLRNPPASKPFAGKKAFQSSRAD